MVGLGKFADAFLAQTQGLSLNLKISRHYRCPVAAPLSQLSGSLLKIGLKAAKQHWVIGRGE